MVLDDPCLEFLEQMNLPTSSAGKHNYFNKDQGKGVPSLGYGMRSMRDPNSKAGTSGLVDDVLGGVWNSNETIS